MHFKFYRLIDFSQVLALTWSVAWSVSDSWVSCSFTVSKRYCSDSGCLLHWLNVSLMYGIFDFDTVAYRTLTVSLISFACNCIVLTLLGYCMKFVIRCRVGPITEMNKNSIMNECSDFSFKFLIQKYKKSETIYCSSTSLILRTVIAQALYPND